MAISKYQHENIIVGAADVFLENPEATGPVTFPEAVPGESYSDTLEGDAGFKPVGLTSGGVEFAYAPDFGEVEVDQWLDVAKMFKQRQSVTVNTTFAEATLEHLLFAWGQPTDTLTGTAGDKTLKISAGELGDKPEERKLAFVGQAPGHPALSAGERRERVYQLDRVLSVESSTHSLSRAEATLIPVALRCLPASAAGGEYGRIIERTFTPAAGAGGGG